MPQDLDLELKSISAANILAYVVHSNVSLLNVVGLLMRFTHFTARIFNHELTSATAFE